FLDTACPTSPQVRTEVESLLAAHVEAGSFVEQSAIHDLHAPSGLAPGVSEDEPPHDRSLTHLNLSRGLPIGSRLGPYEIVSPLGEGGMGVVYRARDTRLNRIVAIKVLSTALVEDPQFRARFTREALALSQLDHPHVCTLYDVGEHQGASFLVMQYLEGE